MTGEEEKRQIVGSMYRITAQERQFRFRSVSRPDHGSRVGLTPFSQTPPQVRFRSALTVRQSDPDAICGRSSAVSDGRFPERGGGQSSVHQGQAVDFIGNVAKVAGTVHNLGGSSSPRRHDFYSFIVGRCRGHFSAAGGRFRCQPKNLRPGRTLQSGRGVDN